MPPLAKKLLTAALTGGVMVSAAWAGASLVPISGGSTPQVTTAPPSLPATEPTPTATPAAEPATDPASAAAELPPAPPAPDSLADGQVLAGAAKMSI